jgi:potassium/hydrogen antiporter
VMPLVFVAPRGLITVLLFLAIPAEQLLPDINKSLVIQIILLSSLVMMAGMMLAKKEPEAVAVPEI